MRGSVLHGGLAGVLGVGLLTGCGGAEPTRIEGEVFMDGDRASAERMLDEMRWRNRALVIASDDGDDTVDRQLAAIAMHSAGWSERDLVTVVLLPDRGHVVRDPSGGLTDAEVLSSEAAASMRRRLGLDAEGFQGALIGKDGGVKARYETIVSPEAVFPFIDAMPMRIDEMEGRR